MTRWQLYFAFIVIKVTRQSSHARRHPYLVVLCHNEMDGWSKPPFVPLLIWDQRKDILLSVVLDLHQPRFAVSSFPIANIRRFSAFSRTRSHPSSGATGRVVSVPELSITGASLWSGFFQHATSSFHIACGVGGLSSAFAVVLAPSVYLLLIEEIYKCCQ